MASGPPSFPTSSSAAAAATTHGGGGLIGSVARTKMQKHIQLLKRNGIVTQPIQPGVPISMATTTTTPSSSSNGGGGVWRKLSFWAPPHRASVAEDLDVVRELDQDVAGALVAVGGTMMGIPAQDLLASPGMRKLVARNIRWFQGTHDLVKLVGLLAAKKLNQWVCNHYGGTTTTEEALVGFKREREEEGDGDNAQTVSGAPSPPFAFKPLRIKLMPSRNETETNNQKNNNTLADVASYSQAENDDNEQRSSKRQRRTTNSGDGSSNSRSADRHSTVANEPEKEDQTKQPQHDKDDEATTLETTTTTMVVDAEETKKHDDDKSKSKTKNPTPPSPFALTTKNNRTNGTRHTTKKTTTHATGSTIDDGIPLESEESQWRMTDEEDLLAGGTNTNTRHHLP